MLTYSHRSTRHGHQDCEGKRAWWKGSFSLITHSYKPTRPRTHMHTDIARTSHTTHILNTQHYFHFMVQFLCHWSASRGERKTVVHTPTVRPVHRANAPLETSCSNALFDIGMNIQSFHPRAPALLIPDQDASSADSTTRQVWGLESKHKQQSTKRNTSPTATARRARLCGHDCVCASLVESANKYPLVACDLITCSPYRRVFFNPPNKREQ